jgi:uncharacterized protein HemY
MDNNTVDNDLPPGAEILDECGVTLARLFPDLAEMERVADCADRSGLAELAEALRANARARRNQAIVKALVAIAKSIARGATQAATEQVDPPRSIADVESEAATLPVRMTVLSGDAETLGAKINELAKRSVARSAETQAASDSIAATQGRSTLRGSMLLDLLTNIPAADLARVSQVINGLARMGERAGRGDAA